MDPLIEGPSGISSSARYGCFEKYSEYQSIINDVYNRLVELKIEEVTSNPEFRQQLEVHFNSLPPSYALYIDLERVKDVLLHQKLLVAKDPDNGPVVHVQSLENFQTWSEGNDEEQVDDLPVPGLDIAEDRKEAVQSHGRCLNGDMKNLEIITQPLRKELLDLISEVPKNSSDSMKKLHLKEEASSRMWDNLHMPVCEVIFSMADTPNLLNQLSELLSGVELYILEAHLFSTTDGHSLGVFVVDGRHGWETKSVQKALERSIDKVSWSASLLSQPAADKTLAAKANCGDWEINITFLTIGEKLADGAYGCLNRGVYCRQDVVVKTFDSKYLQESCRNEVSILREVQHRNLVPFVGAYLKSPKFFIITEYMAGGSLFDYLCNNGAILEVPKFIKFALDVSEGMDYLHQRNIIHRDLKSANVLMSTDDVLKVADFGLSRCIADEMTPDRGTYKWMAPEICIPSIEIMNREPYDQRADIFSFAIFLWELATGEIPYEDMEPIQAVEEVKCGVRPEIPDNMHPTLSDLMQRCWDTDPSDRPSFSEIINELETLLQEVQDEPVP